MRWLGVILLSVLLQNISFASDTIRVNSFQTDIDISSRADFFIDSSTTLQITDFIDESSSIHFNKLGESLPNFGIGYPIIWMKFSLHNTNNEECDYYLDVNFPVLNKIELYEVKDDSCVKVQYAGQDYVYVKSDLNYINPIFRISLKSNETIDYYLRIESYSVKVVPVKIYNTDTFFERKTREKFPVILLLGAIASIIIFNSILFSITRERMYILLALAMFALMINAYGNYGYIFTYDFGIPEYWRTRFRLIGYQFGSIFLLLYGIDFLESKKRFLLGYHLQLYGAVCMFFYMIISVFPVLSVSNIIRVSMFTFPFFAIVQLTVGFVVLYRGYKPAIYFIIAYSSVFTASIIYPLSLTDQIKQSFFIAHINLFASVFFTTLITIGLTERILAVRKAKLRAQMLAETNVKLESEIHERKAIQEDLNRYKSHLEEMVNDRTLELSISENKYRNLIEQMHDWIWQFDENGIITYSSHAVEVIFGIKPEYLIGKHLNVLLSEEQLIDYEALLKAQNKDVNGYTDFESKFQNMKGETVVLESSARPIFDKQGNYKGYSGISRDITMKREFERKVLKTILDTEERERERFSSEIHDGLGATLSGINMYMNVINAESTGEQVRRELSAKVHSLIKQLASDARNIANNLRPYEFVNMGLVVGIQNLTRTLSEVSGIQFKIFAEEYKPILDSDNELMLFRIVSELINNTIKHANASAVEIILSVSDNNITLIYTDNGIGFDLEQMQGAKIISGIKNIHTRVQMLGGTVRIETGENKGVKYHIELTE